MRATIRSLLLSLILALTGVDVSIGSGLPEIPGVYIKTKDGTYSWIPPLAYDTYNLRPVDIETGRSISPRRDTDIQSAIFGMGNVLLAPTTTLSEIDQIVINNADEELRFVFSIAFADEYTTGKKRIFKITSSEIKYEKNEIADNIRSALAVTNWGFSNEKFDMEYADNGARLYYAGDRNNYFSNYTYTLGGANGRKIIEVARAIATSRGIYLFNTPGSLSNLLWNIHINRRHTYIPQMASLVEKLEREASRYNQWGTVAWMYKDFGDKAKAVEIYRDKVMPHTAQLDEKERSMWERYYEAIKE